MVKFKKKIIIQRQFVYKRHKIDSKTYQGESEQIEEKEHVNSSHKEAEVKNTYQTK